MPLVPAGSTVHAVPVDDAKLITLAPVPRYVPSEETPTCPAPMKLVAVKTPDITASVAFNRVIVPIVPVRLVLVR